MTETIAHSPRLLISTALGWSLFLFWIAFVMGRRAGHKKAAQGSSAQLIKGDARAFRISQEIGVETFYDKSGYLVRVEKVREHRYLAQKWLGRNLSREEIVHHINGRRADNRLENLCVLNHLKHEQFHAWLRWKKEKQGYYPSEEQLREVLLHEYGGILLGDVRTPVSSAEG